MMSIPAKSVLDLTTVTWGYFAKGYDPQKNHLGVDFRIGIGGSVKCHFNGDIVVVGGTSPDTYAVVWDGSFSHIFGHLNFKVRIGEVLSGAELGTILPYPTGAHLHYGMNNLKNVPMDREWGWGKCPIKYSRNDASAKGWIDPIMNIFSRNLSANSTVVPLVLHR